MTDLNQDYGVEILIAGERVEVAKSTLDAAFNLVANRENWKLPIDAVIAEGNRDLVAAAVPFFTGSVAKFSPAGEGRLRVRAKGYYEAIGA